MRSIVIYFSQTGNTSKIAKMIHAGMRMVIGECDIATLKEVKPQELGGYDLIGLGGPVWSSKESPNLTEFIDGMNSLEGKHVFPFSTHGTLPSGFMQSVVPALKKKGLIVIGYNDWYGGCIWQGLPKPYFTDGHPDYTDLGEAEDFGREMARLSQHIYQGETHLIPKMPTIKEWNEIYCGKPVIISNELMKASNLTVETRKINMEKCTECGLCVENCPTDGLDFSVSPPVFTSSCLVCFFCEQICPTGAIEVDWAPLTRLHDKYIKILLSPRLDKAEAKGRFRRLVPLKDIGWKTHWYQISGHPRYVIE